MIKQRYVHVLIATLFLCTVHQADAIRFKRATKESAMKQIELTSPSFAHNGSIPQKFTCDGEDISPKLMWKNVPENVKSFVLICDDPDAPKGTWVHWVLFNLQPNVHELSEAAKITRYAGAVEGKNSWGKNTYGGPCPPSGMHRYFFKLYALNILLPLHDNATKKDVVESMQGHIIGQGELMGTYQRSS